MSTQTDPNAAYNAIVRQIAELLIRHDATCGIWDQMSESARKDAVSYFKPMARAMVAEMAHCYQLGFMSNYPDDEGTAVWHEWFENAINECIERGLIPAKPEDND